MFIIWALQDVAWVPKDVSGLSPHRHHLRSQDYYLSLPRWYLGSQRHDLRSQPYTWSLKAVIWDFGCVTWALQDVPWVLCECWWMSLEILDQLLKSQKWYFSSQGCYLRSQREDLRLYNDPWALPYWGLKMVLEWDFGKVTWALMNNVIQALNGLMWEMLFQLSNMCIDKALHESWSLWVTCENHPWKTGQTRIRIREMNPSLRSRDHEWPTANWSFAAPHRPFISLRV